MLADVVCWNYLWYECQRFLPCIVYLSTAIIFLSFNKGSRIPDVSWLWRIRWKRSRPRSCGPSLNPPRLDRGQVRSGPVSIVRWKSPPGTATADPPIARFMNRNSPYKKWPRAWCWLSSVHVTMTCYAHWIPRTWVKKSPAVISPPCEENVLLLCCCWKWVVREDLSTNSESTKSGLVCPCLCWAK